MLYLLDGPLGCGKSTVAAALCHRDHEIEGKKIFSTMPLNFEYTPFTIEYFVHTMAEEGEPLEDCSLLFDEAHQFMDSRDTATKSNKLMTYLMGQSRKRKTDIYLATHSISNLDIRIRKLIQIKGSCKFAKEKPCSKCRCSNCRGTGRVFGLPCSECGGLGATGIDKKGLPCDRCLGFKECGWINVRLYNREARTVSHMKPLWGPNYWGLFSSYDRIPLLARQVTGIDTRMVGGTDNGPKKPVPVGVGASEVV